MPVGFGTDRTPFATEIGQSANKLLSTLSATARIATRTRIRQRGLTRRPLGNRSRTTRNVPAGKTRLSTQLESHAAQRPPGKWGSAISQWRAYSPAAPASDEKKAEAMNSQPIGLVR